MEKQSDAPRATFGLFVGIDDYQDDVVPDLKYCGEDAEAMSQAFKPRNSGLTIKLLNEEATRLRILTDLNFIMKFIQPGDCLLFFVATHGVVKYNDFFFFPYDVDPNNLLGTGIPSKLLINSLAAMVQGGVECLIVFDSCYCGSIGFDISKSQSTDQGGLSCLLSASPMEKSRESPQKRKGIFSHFMIEGLKGKAGRKETGPVFLRDLYDYVYSRTKRATRKRQHPVLIGTLGNETILNENWPTWNPHS